MLCLSPDSKYDKLFILGKYKYHETWSRLLLLEEFTEKKQVQIRRIFQTIKRNYKASGKLHTKSHSRFIEALIENALIDYYGDNWKFFWRNSSLLTKINFFYIILLPISFFIGVEIAFALDPDSGELLSQMPVSFFIALPALIMVVIMFAIIAIIANIVLYYICISILRLFGFESGTLNKNVTALESITDSIKFYKNSALILAFGGIIGSTAVAKISSFKGLGGGKFGGGGAGGSW